VDGGAGNDIIRAGTGADQMRRTETTSSRSPARRKKHHHRFSYRRDLLDLTKLIEVLRLRGNDPWRMAPWALQRMGAWGLTISVDPPSMTDGDHRAYDGPAAYRRWTCSSSGLIRGNLLQRSRHDPRVVRHGA